MESPNDPEILPESSQAIDSEDNEHILCINENIDFTHKTNGNDNNSLFHESDDNKLSIETKADDETHELTAEVVDLIISNNCIEISVNSNSVESLQSQCQQMQQLLEQKEDLIELQKRELEVLEKEKQAIKRNYEISQKEKETAVVRYAMVEKNIIDLKTSNEQSNRRLKDKEKEIDALNARLKFVMNEKERSNKELRKSLAHCEGLKNELSLLESKHKWCPVKLKQELIEKSALETKINELTQQVNQLNEFRQQSIDNIKYEEKASEAQVILFKHKSEEREKENNMLMAKISQLKSDVDNLTGKLNVLTKEHEELNVRFTEKHKLLEETQYKNQNHEETLKDLESKLDETQVLLKEQLILGEEYTKELKELRQIRSAYHEQQQETAKIRSREEHLMTLTKDLTEKSVSLESRLILSDSKSTALSIESRKIKEVYEKHKNRISDLEQELNSIKDVHGKELDSINSIIADKDKQNETLQSQLDNSIGELEANKRKHNQIIKELNREVIVLRTKLNPNPIQQQNRDEVKEPTKKSLIDRIVRLQRALARQTEKNEFLENHCAALLNQLKTKS